MNISNREEKLKQIGRIQEQIVKFQVQLNEICYEMAQYERLRRNFEDDSEIQDFIYKLQQDKWERFEKMENLEIKLSHLLREVNFGTLVI